MLRSIKKLFIFRFGKSIIKPQIEREFYSELLHYIGNQCSVTVVTGPAIIRHLINIVRIVGFQHKIYLVDWKQTVLDVILKKIQLKCLHYLLPNQLFTYCGDVVNAPINVFMDIDLTCRKGNIGRFCDIIGKQQESYYPSKVKGIICATSRRTSNGTGEEPDDIILKDLRRVYKVLGYHIVSFERIKLFKKTLPNGCRIYKHEIIPELVALYDPEKILYQKIYVYNAGGGPMLTFAFAYHKPQIITNTNR